jgi:pimeloyl-ACP methyl ester carboxylesterase
VSAIEVDYVETDVGKVQLRRGGRGAPVVYLHSATGEGDGLQLLDLLAERVEVIAPQFPGFGESEGIEVIDDMEDAVFHLLDVFDRLELDRPAVVGLSLGAWMAVELATRYPDRLSKLVLINPVGLFIEGAEIKDIFGRTPDQLAEDMFADQSHPMAQMMHAMAEFSSDPTRMSEMPFELIRPLAQTMAATAKLGWDPYLHNPKLRKRLHRVSVPTLVIRGVQDSLVPPEHAQAYASAIPGARLLEVDGAAHLLPMEKASDLADAIVDHVTG